MTSMLIKIKSAHIEIEIKLAVGLVGLKISQGEVLAVGHHG